MGFHFSWQEISTCSTWKGILHDERLQEAAEIALFTLTKDFTYPTCHELHEDQRDTILDLTWVNSTLVTKWQCGPDPMRSDPYPIWLWLPIGSRA
ncbi:hypothetical protein IscW_ISCW009775 [Ixodes scapularis]|uniref:Uncharacterized protein n=1 Tax=Ixodes scapularis TaxID=6945 RepID=B7Q048_IXOSC|nr:hypothetical protein IscW_ISCW009775 [Ixodes scapularis]|eukprot:XP_002406855.1 hypothetical protein IscW_ISCW009775 [Ixodes scapularis]